MLDEKEKKKIFELIKKGYTDYRIAKMTNHSHDTITCFRKELLKNLKYPASEDEENFDSAIDFTRSMISKFEKYINTHQQGEKRKKEHEKYLEKLKEILHSEVNERMPKEIEDAIKIRDQERNKKIEQQYVRKEVVEDYENTLKEKNIIIENLKNENKKKDDTIMKNQTVYHQNLIDKQNEIDLLKNQINNINNERLNIMKENICLKNYINNRLDSYVRLGQQELNRNNEILKYQKINFENYINYNLNFFNAFLLKMNSTLEAITIQKDDQDTFNRKMGIFVDMFDEERAAVQKKREELRIKEHELQKWEKQLADIINFLNTHSLVDLNSGKPLHVNILNIDTNQKNNKAPSENYTHN